MKIMLFRDGQRGVVVRRPGWRPAEGDRGAAGAVGGGAGGICSGQRRGGHAHPPAQEALQARDEARKAAETAQAERWNAEEARAKMKGGVGVAFYSCGIRMS